MSLKVDLIATGGGYHRVERAGAVVSQHSQQHKAHVAGVNAALATPDEPVTIVTETTLRVEITGQQTCPAPEPVEPTPVDPVDPTPEEPEPEEPTPTDPTDPEEPEDPVEPEIPDPDPEPEEPPIIAPPTGSLFDIGATLSPGEYRVIGEAGVSFKAGSYDAFGWTPRWPYEPVSKTFWNVGCRDNSPKVLVWFNAETGEWGRRLIPLDTLVTDRRPFARLTVVDIGDGMGPCLYWPSSKERPSYGRSGRRSIGALIRAPISKFLSGEIQDWEGLSWATAADEIAHGWEQFSPPLNISNMNTAGDFAVEWYPELGGWVFQGRKSSNAWNSTSAITQEGHIEGYETHSWYSRLMYWKPGMDAWVDFDRIYGGQYQGMTAYNPIKKICLNFGGSEFGSQPVGELPSKEFTRIEDGPIARKFGRMFVDGVEAGFSPTTRYCSLGHCPVTGDWLLLRREDDGDPRWHSKLWRSADGKNWTVYRDFANDLTDLFGITYISMTPIPDTDLILFISQNRRITLHRVPV